MLIPLSNTGLQRIGLKVVELITLRTLEGKDYEDKPFKPYSTKPFAMPSGATTKSSLKVLGKDNFSYFRTKSGSLWIVVKGGYQALKKARMSGTDYTGGVNLSLSGAMLRGLKVISSSANLVKIGFSRSELAQRAYFNEAKGRKFLGISPKDLENLKPTILDGINESIKSK